ncbi:MAG: P-II family nitrogen regulator [Deltaproteobacteria bacterium]|nr:P-II family nitrogen regulator [Deltaproteobacteria bacterium]
MKQLSDYGKLLMCTVGRNKGDKLMAVAKAAGARGGTVMLGRSKQGNRLLKALSLDDVLQDVVLTLVRAECKAVFEAIVDLAAKAPAQFGGTAMLLDVPTFLAHTVADNQINAHGTGTKMESGHQLITVIVNSGYGDDVMEVARKAGAHGGTIMSARGTGTAEDVKFFAITIVPEKEILLIVSQTGAVGAILDAIGTVPVFSQPGGGIAYCMNIEQFVHLGPKQ